MAREDGGLPRASRGAGRGVGLPWGWGASLRDVLAFHGVSRQRRCRQRGLESGLGGAREQQGPLGGSQPWAPSIL